MILEDAYIVLVIKYKALQRPETCDLYTNDM